MDSLIRIKEILAGEPPGLSQLAESARLIGESRQKRPIVGFCLGAGECRISLIGGCHADEPVGPALLRRLVYWLMQQSSGHPLLRDYRWMVVPHTNPDGEVRNRAWSDRTQPLVDSAGKADEGYVLRDFLAHAVREVPPDDVEFGFPRHSKDGGARPENRAVARFLEGEGPFALHGTFHGLSVGVGPWFLLEPAWVARTQQLRLHVAKQVRRLGYRLLDVDRKGEKGFSRIEEGFSTRPDSEAMRAFFVARDDERMARAFRPSSMEWVRSLGGDPLTFVSEMPLFLAQSPPKMGVSLRDWLLEAALTKSRVDIASAEPRAQELEPLGGSEQEGAQRAGCETGDSLEEAIALAGIRPMPIRDQMRLQLTLLQAGLASACPRSCSAGGPP